MAESLYGADQFFWVYGRPKPSNQGEMSQALVYRVEPGYLKAMGITLKRGRFFTDQDDERSQPVAVIDEILARKYFGDADPIGQRIQQTGHDPRQIVGVVGHMKQWSLDEDENASLEAQLYVPFRALADPAMPSDVRVVARSDGPAPFDSIRHVIQSQNERNVISKPQTMNEVIAASLAERRFLMILLDVFAVLALLLASIGLYGVISYLVGQRTHELGIRLALGAQRDDVLRLVLTDGMKMTLCGMAVGLFLRWA
jgi:ABC-type antimicrobial peptide transport system permease subunit